MEKGFITDYLQISLSRDQRNKIHLSISSDFTGSDRKSQLYVNGDRLSNDLHSVWKRIKTKKLLSLSVHFDEIDWYDDMCDVYDTPYISIKRGLRKPRIGYNQHGSIPKEWGITVNGTLENTTTKTPIIEVIKNVLGYKFTTEHEKKFTKGLKKFLRNEVSHVNYYYDC